MSVIDGFRKAAAAGVLIFCSMKAEGIMFAFSFVCVNIITNTRLAHQLALFFGPGGIFFVSVTQGVYFLS